MNVEESASPIDGSSKSTVQAFLGHLSAGQLEAAFALFSPDVRIVGPDGVEIALDQFKATFAGFGELLAGPYQQEVVSMIADGGKVAVEATGSAPLRNGRLYANVYHFAFDIDGGKITGMREYCDTRAIDRAFAPG